MKRKLASIAIFALFMVSMLPIVVLPAHAGSVVAAKSTGCASCTSSSLTFTSVLVGDTFILAALEGPSANYPGFPTTSLGNAPNSQFTDSLSGNDGSYQTRISSFTAGSSGTDTITATYTVSTASFFVAYQLRGINATKALSTTASANGHEVSQTVSSIPANGFTLILAWTTDSASQSWSLAAGNGVGGVLVCDTCTRKGASQYVLNAPSSFHFDMEGGAGSFARADTLAFRPLAGGGGTIGLDVTILNMDLTNYLVVPYNKFYNFNETAIGVHGSNVNIVKWKWTDGASTAEVQYSNLTKTATVLQGNNIITIGSPTATSSIVGGQRKLQVIIPVRLSENALDTTGVSINAYSQLADGTTTGYLVVRSKYFNIFNQGGTITPYQIVGPGCAPSPILSGIFSVLCQDKGWIMANSTWFQLQSYHTEFAINLNDNFGAPDPFLFQDFANSNGGAEHYTTTGNWKIDIGWFYFVNGAWTKAFHVVLEMQQGNQGVQDQWTQVNATFYNGKNTKVSSQLFDVWIEQSPRSQIRLYVDLWISKLNSSSLHAMRVGAYYYAIHQSGFTFFGTWSPFLQNASSAMTFAKNIDSTGKTIDAQQISFSKLYWNVSRSTHPVGQANFQIFTKDFNLEQFKATKGRMEGVDTPIFVDAKIPTLPIDGFFAPLYAAITSIGDFIWSALAAAFSAIWVSIGSRFPWFTGFWDSVGANIGGFGNLFVSITQQLGGFLSFLFSIFSFVTAPIQIVVKAWSFLANAFSTVFPGASLGQWATLFVIVVFGLSFFEAAMTGDWPWIIRFARQTWAIVNAIMFWTYHFAKVIIDAVLAIIP